MKARRAWRSSKSPMRRVSLPPPESSTRPGCSPVGIRSCLHLQGTRRYVVVAIALTVAVVIFAVFLAGFIYGLCGTFV